MAVPTGVNFGADCRETFNEGASAKLTTTADPDGVFTGLGGDCSGCRTNTTCNVTMNTDRACKAGFEDVPPGHWAFEYTNSIYHRDIIGGCSSNPPLYCPYSSVTRAQMAVFLTKGFLK